MTEPQPSDPRPSNALTWTAFLCIAFAIVGLTALFATFAAPLPLQRALAREQTLDEAAAAIGATDAAARLEALRDRLGDSAEAVLPPSADEPARIARERTSMRARFLHQAGAEAAQLRLMIAVVTVMSAAFGAALMRLARSRT